MKYRKSEIIDFFEFLELLNLRALIALSGALFAFLFLEIKEKIIYIFFLSEEKSISFA